MCCSARHPGGRVTFSACPEKVTKERAPGCGAGALRRFATGGRGFADRPSMACGKSGAIHRAAPRWRAGLIRPPFAAPHGQRQEREPKQRRWVPAFAGTTKFVAGANLKTLESRATPLSRLRKRVRVRARWLTISLNVASAARTAALCSSRVPSRPRRGRGGKSPQGRAHDARAFAVRPGTACQRTSVASSRSRRAGARRPRSRGCVLFGYFLLHKQEKVTPSQGCEGNSQGRESGFVTTPKNQKTKADGFRLPPE